MRVGQNPMRNSNADMSLPPVVVAITTHLPDVMDPYHRDRLAILEACVTSARKFAGMDHQVMIWDNGSCSQVQGWLRYTVKPDFLILSHNIGKTSAQKMQLRMFPPGTIVALSDDDVLYYPDWLQTSVEVLRGLPPTAGAVSCCPSKNKTTYHISTTAQWATNEGILTLEKNTPQRDQWDRDFAISVGRPLEDYKREYDRFPWPVITWQNRRLLAGCSHVQFVCYAERIEPCFRWGKRAMGEQNTFDQAINDRGLLRIFTDDRLARHMGNVFDEDLEREAERIGVWR